MQSTSDVAASMAYSRSERLSPTDRTLGLCWDMGLPLGARFLAPHLLTLNRNFRSRKQTKRGPKIRCRLDVSDLFGVGQSAILGALLESTAFPVVARVALRHPGRNHDAMNITAPTSPSASPFKAGQLNMRQCRSCRAGISQKAYTCPHCGEPYRLSRSDIVLTIFFWLAVILFVYVFIIRIAAR